MAQNIIIAGKENPIVIEYTGIDLTQATDILVEIKQGFSTTQYTLLLAPSVVVVTSPTTLSVYLGAEPLAALEFHISVTYFDNNTGSDGLQISGREIGDLVTVEISSVSSVAPFFESFVFASEFTDYLYRRRLPVPRSTTQMDQCLLDGMDYIQTFEHLLQGSRSQRDQPLMFPRRGVYLHGYLLDSTETPFQIKQAQMEAAAYAVENNLMASDKTSNIQSEELDGLKTSYFKGGAKTNVRLQRVMAAMAPLMCDNSKLVRT